MGLIIRMRMFNSVKPRDAVCLKFGADFLLL